MRIIVLTGISSERVKRRAEADLIDEILVKETTAGSLIQTLKAFGAVHA